MDGVHFNGPPLAAKADDAITRNRMAAFTQLERNSGRQPADRDRPFLRRPVLLVTARIETRDQRFHHTPVAEFARADSQHQFVFAVEL